MLLLHKNIDITSVGIFFFGFLNINNYFCKKKKSITLFTGPTLKKNVAFLYYQANKRKRAVGNWTFGVLFYHFISTFNTFPKILQKIEIYKPEISCTSLSLNKMMVI